MSACVQWEAQSFCDRVYKNVLALHKFLRFMVFKSYLRTERKKQQLLGFRHLALATMVFRVLTWLFNFANDLCRHWAIFVTKVCTVARWALNNMEQDASWGYSDGHVLGHPLTLAQGYLSSFVAFPEPDILSYTALVSAGRGAEKVPLKFWLIEINSINYTSSKINEQYIVKKSNNQKQNSSKKEKERDIEREREIETGT